MNEKIMGAMLRHVLTLGAGALVSKGLIESAAAEQVVGALMAIVGVGWSVYQKLKAAK